MYQGRYVTRRDSRKAARSKSRRYHSKRLAVLVLAFALIVSIAVGGTIAYLTTKTDGIVNTFSPSHVNCEVTERFDGATKTDVNVKNTGDIPAYIRVKLVSYRANNAGQHIGGEAQLPSFDLGTNWVMYGDYYYYTLPVEAGKTPAANLTDSMTLTASYQDADGGKQVIEVMAEAIQSEPARAVGQAWGVSISQGSVTAYSGN